VRFPETVPDVLTGNIVPKECFNLRIFFPQSCTIDLITNLINFQRNSTSLISSMDHTVTEVMTLEITSMNMQAMIVTTACMSSIFLLLVFSIFSCMCRFVDN